MQLFSEMKEPQFTWVTGLIEQKILSQMSRIISGAVSADEGIETARRINEVASDLVGSSNRVSKLAD